MATVTTDSASTPSAPEALPALPPPAPGTSSFARHAFSLGLGAFGAVLLGAALTQQGQWRLMWFAFSASVWAVGMTLLAHQWQAWRQCRRDHADALQAREHERQELLRAAAEERAAAMVEERHPAMDDCARALLGAQIALWELDVAQGRLTLHGTHEGNRDFNPALRECTEREWLDSLHPQDRDPVQSCWRAFTAGETPHFEQEFRQADGRGGWRWLLSRGLVVAQDADGRPLRAAGTHTDIHQRKLALVARAQERGLVDAGPVVLWRFDVRPPWTIDFMSRNAARLWGHGGAEWSATGQSARDLVHPQDWTVVQDSLARAASAGESGWEAQARVQMADGAWRWQLLRAVFEEDQGRRHARGCLIDIDARKAMEADSAEHRLALEALVQELNMAQADSIVLQDTSDLLNSAEDVDEAFEIVRRAAGAVFPGWSGALSAIMPHGGLHLVGHWGEPPDQDAEFDVKDCWGLRRGRPHGYFSADRQLRCRHIHPSPGSRLMPYVCVPMSANGETVGALHLFANTFVTPKSLADIEARAERFCETLKLALSNLRLRAWLRDQATRDGLTGLYNRRLLDERLPIEIRRSQRDGQPVALAMLDVDHFKRFNDQYGHDAGDAVLKALSELLLERVRVYDFACRYGGEELALIMPSCQMDDAIVKMETLRADIAAMTILHQGRALPRVTVSIGLAQTLGGSAESLLRRADEALYAAKRQGRNRLQVDPLGNLPLREGAQA